MIAIQNLSMRFGEETRISYEDFTFENGSSYVILGPSGCGKSTLLNLIAGILAPTDGSVLFDGRDMANASQRERDAFRIGHIGYIFQDFKLLEGMSVEDNLRVLSLEKIDLSGMDGALESLGIRHLKKRVVRRLSGGEKQRVAIVRALMLRPEVILADEPTGNLNFEIGSAVVDRLLEVSRGRTLIAVTHDDRLAPRFDHVLDMESLSRAEVIARV